VVLVYLILNNKSIADVHVETEEPGSSLLAAEVHLPHGAPPDRLWGAELEGALELKFL